MYEGGEDRGCIRSSVIEKKWEDTKLKKLLTSIPFFVTDNRALRL